MSYSRAKTNVIDRTVMYLIPEWLLGIDRKPITCASGIRQITVYIYEIFTYNHHGSSDAY